MTPLIFAAVINNRKGAAELLTFGADINYQTHSGITAIKATAYNMHTKLLSILVKNGADINKGHFCTGTALHAVCKRRYATFRMATIQFDIIQFLLCNGADISAKAIGNFTDQTCTDMLLDSLNITIFPVFHQPKLYEETLLKMKMPIFLYLLACGSQIPKTSVVEKIPHKLFHKFHVTKLDRTNTITLLSITKNYIRSILLKYNPNLQIAVAGLNLPHCLIKELLYHNKHAVTFNAFLTKVDIK